MFPFYLAAAAASLPAVPLPLTPAPASSSLAAERFEACSELSARDPAKAIDEATNWKQAGGGVLARQCEGLGYAALKQWASAQLAFEQAAQLAETEKDSRAARLWVQAGNAALAGGESEKARTCFDAAITGGELPAQERGEAHLDRARALVALRQFKDARSDLDKALELVPADPLAWLLSATLARRMGDLAQASLDIAEATKRAPDDAQVALEAGNIAIMRGNQSAARTAWQKAVKLSPESMAGNSAAQSLAQLGASQPSKP